MGLTITLVRGLPELAESPVLKGGDECVEPALFYAANVSCSPTNPFLKGSHHDRCTQAF